uniref:Uncharacterized protein n=1 Tax=Lepeophtheirus salmonis TaxID=72036 RepID=A0A0K2V9I8_LEPSM
MYTILIINTLDLGVESNIDAHSSLCLFSSL